jgi:hypothetical protein
VLLLNAVRLRGTCVRISMGKVASCTHAQCSDLTVLQSADHPRKSAVTSVLQELASKQHLLKTLQQSKASQASYHALPPLPRRKPSVGQLREQLAALQARHADQQVCTCVRTTLFVLSGCYACP